MSGDDTMSANIVGTIKLKGTSRRSKALNVPLASLLGPDVKAFP